MNLKKATEQSNTIYEFFKDYVCDECKEKINNKLSKFNKIQMALLVANPKLIHKKLGICQNCINNIHRQLLKNARNNN